MSNERNLRYVLLHKGTKETKLEIIRLLEIIELTMEFRDIKKHKISALLGNED
jgi:hypothetical protein